MKEKIKNKIKNLVEILNVYNHHYYSGNPLIEDSEYDYLYEELSELEKANPDLAILKNSPTKKVGNVFMDNLFKKVPHNKKMLSLEKANSEKELTQFLKRTINEINFFELVCEPKIDGVSLALRYESGVLVQALTRGDGEKGEDVTNNVITIKSIPKTLSKPFSVEIRGELVFYKKDFELFNENNKYSNPRNTVAGLLRNKDSKNFKKNVPISFIAFDIFSLQGDDFNFVGHFDKIDKLQFLKFTTPINKAIIDISSNSVYQKVLEMRDILPSLDYETDGLVLKVNNLEDQKKLGERTKSPKWALAYKFPAKKEKATILDVEFNVGRTGKITPVAILTPTKLDGTIVSRATLNNMSYIEHQLGGLRIGDEVYIEKAGDIIPKVVSICTNNEGQIIKLPSVCSCPLKKEWLRNKKEKTERCEHQVCPNKNKGNLDLAISKKGLNIDGLGGKTLETLIEYNLIENLPDVLRLEEVKDGFLQIKGFGQKKFYNIVESIKKSIEQATFDRVLYALGIPHLGSTKTKELVKKLYNIELFLKAKKEDILSIEGFGNETAEAILDWLDNEDNLSLIKELQSLGLPMEVKEQNQIKKGSSKVQGLNILLSGKFALNSEDSLDRKALEKLLTELGANIKTSVSSKLNIMVVGENPGASKVTKAKSLGVKIMNETEFKSEYKIY